MTTRVADIRSLARSYSESAIKTLAGIMGSENCSDRDRITAANILLERGWGKPTQPISGDEENPLTLVTRIELVPAISPPPF